METNEIQELILSGKITISTNKVSIFYENIVGNYLIANSRPKDNYWCVDLYDYNSESIPLTDEQYNMVCKYMESEFNEYHSNNSAFTDDDKEHFNSLI